MRFVKNVYSALTPGTVSVQFWLSGPDSDWNLLTKEAESSGREPTGTDLMIRPETVWTNVRWSGFLKQELFLTI